MPYLLQEDTPPPKQRESKKKITKIRYMNTSLPRLTDLIKEGSYPSSQGIGLAGDGTKQKADRDKIAHFLWSVPAFEGMSESEIRAILDDVYAEWETLKTQYQNNIDTYIDYLDNTGGLQAFLREVNTMKTTRQRLMELAGLSSQTDVIGTPYRVGSLEVAQYDFPQQMNFKDAQTAIASLGSGWRLPTQEEGSMLFKMSSKLGFATSQNDAPYWLGGEGAKGWGERSASQIHMRDGLIDQDDAINYKNNVRAVRG